MLNLDDIYKRLEDKWVSRFILDEVVIMSLCKSEADMGYVYSISNETGSRIWQLLDGKYTVRDIQEILKSEYQGQTEVIEREVLEFLTDILEAELITKAGTKRSSVPSHQPSAKKKTYKSPEIAKVKLQPEQAVLSCCITNGAYKSNGANVCAVTDGCNINPTDCSAADSSCNTSIAAS